MQKIDALLARVGDPALRLELANAVEELRRTSDFGLVWESHLPETVRLPGHRLRRGLKVALRASKHKATFMVSSIDGGVAVLVPYKDPKGVRIEPDLATDTLSAPVEDLVVVADFGETIYPGFRRVRSLSRGGEKPAHVVIKGENHHVLEALQFTHEGRVDCVYIDPPYNTGARDWKYDNDYVDPDDRYRHSKWLAFMERRLLLARKLLNPEDSVLIVAIDEKEYLRLGLLLQQVFRGATHQMVTTVIKPEGTGRVNEFSRTNEFLFFVMIGNTAIVPGPDNMYDRDGSEGGQSVEWRNLRRRERTSVRGSRPQQFYAVFVDEETGRIHSVGDPLNDDVDVATVVAPPGTRAMYPVTPGGVQMIWSLIPTSLRELVTKGYARFNGQILQFLNSGTVAAIERGDVILEGHEDSGGVIARFPEAKTLMPKTVWTRESHNAQTSGTLVLNRLLPGRQFPYPKSLYAVEDTLRFFVKNKPDAIILDYFGGSGTTSHAVARLNRADGGRRQSILVTNNEVSSNEARAFSKNGVRPGDAEWEEKGIFESITLPRISAAIAGQTPEGVPVAGAYKFGEQFPMSDGFEENVEFLELTYEDVARIELDLAFAAVAPLLWLRAGGTGAMIEQRSPLSGDYDSTDNYAILFNADRWQPFIASLPDSVATVFIVTDSPTVFAKVAVELPTTVRDAVRLYERYLTTFGINERAEA